MALHTWETTMITSSPADIAEQIFRESPYHAIRDLKCNFRDGVLTIAGRVPSYYLKQLAQSTVRDLNGVRHILNLTEVSQEH
jgi:hypothetical protein